MKKEKLKHIVLTVVAVAFIGIGYLNYDYDSTIEVASTNTQIDSNTSIGDAQLVNANPVKEDIVPNDDMRNNSNKYRCNS